MSGKSKATILAVLAVGLAWLTWFLILGQNDAFKEENSTATYAEAGIVQSGAAGISVPDDSGGDIAADKNDEAAATEPAVESTTEAAIEREVVVGKLLLVGPEGSAVGGRVELIQVNESFTTHMSTMARIGPAIYYDSIVQETQVAEADGLLEITPDGNRADFVIVFAPGYRPQLEAWEPIAVNETRTISLTKAEPIAVTVVTDDGKPIKNALVYYRWTGVFSQNKTAPLLDRFQQRFFQEAAVTDDDGKVVLTSTFPDWSTELFVRPGDLWATVVQTVEAGKPIEIRCPSAFMVTGFVTVNGKIPEQEVQLKATVHAGDQYWILESGRAKEEGKYEIAGIPSGYPAYQIEAMGKGLANQTKDIFAPQPGNILSLDFQMKEGFGSSLQLFDTWGEPIPNGRVKFVAEGARSHMYGYNSDANGLVEFPPIFTKGESWWLNLRLADTLYLRLEQAFHVGETMRITVPNLARVSAVEISDDLLGEAKIVRAVWVGHSSQSWGTVSWSPETADSTLFASGSGNLTITLSDGRQIRQPVTLAPGSVGPVIVDRKPATLKFELPNDPPASVSITTQTGATIYEQEGLSGQVSIPLWQGQYSFLAIWPEDAREIPHIAITESAVDLGMITPASAGHIEGTVRDSDGKPVQWARTSLSSVDGFSTQSWSTEEDGRFAFFDVPIGRYYILCNTAGSYGSKSATTIEMVTVSADRLNQEVNLELRLDEQSQVHLTCNNDWSFNAYAILATADASSHAPVRSQGTTILTAQLQPGWLGSAQILDAEVRAQAQQIPAGGGQYTLPTTAMHDSSLRFVDELGQPWKHLLLRLELEGQPLTRRPTLDHDGMLRLSSNQDAPWSLQACAPSGQIFRFDLAAMNSAETLVIPRITSGREVVVQSETGQPIPWPTLQSVDGSTVFPSDKNGHAIIPTEFDQPLVISAVGYLSCWTTNPQVDSFTLPKRIDGLTLHAPAGISLLRWTSEVPFQSIWGTGLEQSPGQTIWPLPPIHAGRFSFSAFDENGALIGEREFTLREDGQVLNWGE